MQPLLQLYGTSTAQKTEGLALVLYVCGAVGMAGLLWTFIFTQETGGLRIEDLDAGVTPLLQADLHPHVDREALLAARKTNDRIARGQNSQGVAAGAGAAAAEGGSAFGSGSGVYEAAGAGAGAVTHQLHFAGFQHEGTGHGGAVTGVVGSLQRSGDEERQHFLA